MGRFDNPGKLLLGSERKYKHGTNTVLILCLIKFLSASILRGGKV